MKGQTEKIIAFGTYELMLDEQGGPIFTGVRGIGDLSYSGKHPRHGAFRLFMPLPSYYGQYVDAADFTEVQQQNLPDGIAFEYRKPVVRGQEYDIKVILKVGPSKEGDSLEFTLSVQNDSPYLIKEAWITGFEGLNRLNDTDHFHLRHTERCMDDLLWSPVNTGWEFYTPGRDYLRLGQWGMPFTIFDTGTVSFYLSTHDVTKRETSTLIERYPGRNASEYLPPDIEPEMSCYYIYRVQLRPGENATLGKFVLAMAAGDWHVFRDIYRRWQFTNFPPYPHNPYYDRYDGWQHKVLLPNDGSIWNHFEELPQLYKKLNETTGLTCMMIYGHTEEGSDLSEPDVEPAEKAGGLPAFQKALDEIHTMGGKVFIMTKANRASTRAPEWDAEWHKSVIVNNWGEEQYISFQIECALESGFSGRRNGRMCMFDRDWQDFISKRLSRLAQIGVDGIQLDELPDIPSCYSTKHDHRDPTVEGFAGLQQILGKIQTECRKFNPDIMMGGEELSDYVFHWLDFSFSRWACKNTDTGITNGRIFRYYLPEVVTHTRMQSYEIDQASYALLLGTPIDIEVNGLRSMIYECPLGLERVRAMLKLRRLHGRFFYEGTFMDTLNFKEQSDKVVHYGSHRAANGDDLLIIINRLDEDAAAHILPEKNYEGYRILEGYNGQIIETQALDCDYPVKAHDILVVECRCS